MFNIFVNNTKQMVKIGVYEIVIETYLLNDLSLFYDLIR